MNIGYCQHYNELYLEPLDWSLLSEPLRLELLEYCGLDHNTEKTAVILKVPFGPNESAYSNASKIKGHILQRIKSYLKNAKSRARRIELQNIAQGKHSSEDLRKIFFWQKGLCYFCSAKLKLNRFGLISSNGSSAHLDHLTALANEGTLFPSNLAWLCATCNCSKNKKNESEFWNITKIRLGAEHVRKARKLKISYLYKKRKLDEIYI